MSSKHLYDKITSKTLIREFMKIWLSDSEDKKKKMNGLTKFFSYDDWIYLSKFNKLPFDIVLEYKDQLNWFWITRTHIMTKEFITEFFDYLDKDYLKRLYNMN